MKKRLFNGLLFLMALLGWGGHKVVAQNRIDLTIKYNTTTSLYEVYGRPNFTDPAFGVGAGTQISVVFPASVADNPLTVTSVNGGAWSDASKVYAPAADPAEDFHGIATAGAYVSLVSGQEILFFTFGIAGVCMPGVRLFENPTDPSSSAAGFSGGDYKNYIGDALSSGDDVYRSNYTTPGGLCGIPPTIGFTSPANGTKTTMTPTISGTTTPGASVTVGEGGSTICTTTATASGTWSCPNPAPFPAGPHTLTAVASNASGTSPTATTSFSVVAPPTIAITGPATGTTTTTTPVITGTATPGSSVTVGENGNTLCTTTASTSGAWSCSVTLPTGPHNVTAVASNEGGPSTPASTSFTVAGPPTIAIVSPATGTTATTTPTITGTATPGASVTVGENGTTICTTTASTSGAWSCSGITFPTGPHTVTAVASNNGGTSPTATTNFTVVTGTTSLTSGPGGVFNDLNGNCVANAGENLSGLPTPLYVKLINSSTPTVAQQAVAVSSDGSYTFSGVADGSYSIIVDDNATVSDVTPLAGYTNTSRGPLPFFGGRFILAADAPAPSPFCLQPTCPPFTLPTLSK